MTKKKRLFLKAIGLNLFSFAINKFGGYNQTIYFPTLKEAKKSNVVAHGTTVITGGYNTTGDNGGASYKILKNNKIKADGYGSHIFMNNLIGVLEHKQCTAETFGFINKKDCTSQMLAAASSGKEIKFNKNKSYTIKNTFHLSNETKITGRETILRIEGNKTVFTLGENSSIDGFIIDGLNLDHSPYISKLVDNSSGQTLKNLEFHNFKGQKSFQTYCIKVPLFDCIGFQISNIKFKNITQIDNGKVAGKGFVGCVYFHSDKKGSITSSGRLRDLYAENIQSLDGGNGVVQDSDMIRCYTELNISNYNWNITFETIIGYNVGKRIFKTGGMNGCVVRNVIGISNLHYDMFSVITLSNSSSRWKISNVYCKGSIERGIQITGIENMISGIYFDGEGAKNPRYGIIFGLSKNSHSIKCTVENIQVKNCNTGIYFYNGMSNNARNIKTRTQISVLSNKDIKYKNTVKNLYAELGGLVIMKNSTLNISDAILKKQKSNALGIDIRGGSLFSKRVEVESKNRIPIKITFSNNSNISLEKTKIFTQVKSGKPYLIDVDSKNNGIINLKDVKFIMVSNKESKCIDIAQEKIIIKNGKVLLKEKKNTVSNLIKRVIKTS